MRWLRPLFILLFAGISFGSARAADQGSQATTLTTPLLAGSGDQAALLQSPFANSPFAKHMLSYGLLKPDTLEPDANDNVCYTMRSYKVKRKERFAEGERGPTGYSTCQSASSFHIRWADEDAQPSPK
jgi:hypothetical protein